MTTTVTILFICLGYLMAKHFIADFVLQNAYQIAGKARYGHPGGLLHVTIHAILSAPLFWLVPHIAPSWFALIITGEMIVHYHIDWGKEQLLQRTGWTPRDQQFWRLFGVDQLLHMASYLLMAALIML